jgi:hypothetical protein
MQPRPAAALITVDPRCAADEQDIITRLAQDPWASAGLLRIGTIEPWALWLDSRPKSYP